MLWLPTGFHKYRPERFAGRGDTQTVLGHILFMKQAQQLRKTILNKICKLFCSQRVAWNSSTHL
jgi:hypothetical protein